MIWTILFVIFNAIMAGRAVARRDIFSLFLYLFVDMVFASLVINYPSWFDGVIDQNLMFCGIVALVDAVCIVIAFMRRP